MLKNLLFLFTALSFQSFAQCDPNEIFQNDSTNAVCMEIDNTVRVVYTNNLPNHPYGTWASNNPVDAHDLTFYVCAFLQFLNFQLAVIFFN